MSGLAKNGRELRKYFWHKFCYPSITGKLVKKGGERWKRENKGL